MKLTPRQQHLIHCLAEEAGEIAQIAGKIGRFGPCDSHEKTGNIQNHVLMSREFNDLVGVLEFMKEEGLPVFNLFDRDQIEDKKDRLRIFMKYAEERGML